MSEIFELQYHHPHPVSLASSVRPPNLFPHAEAQGEDEASLFSRRRVTMLTQLMPTPILGYLSGSDAVALVGMHARTPHMQQRIHARDKLVPARARPNDVLIARNAEMHLPPSLKSLMSSHRKSLRHCLSFIKIGYEAGYYLQWGMFSQHS